MRTFFNIKGALVVMGSATLLLSSCDSRRLGSIEGNISGADGQLLILEHLTDGSPRMVDTLRLNAEGKFKFAPEVEQGPDFFSLRLGSQSISLVIDTLLTPVEISAEAGSLSSAYVVKDDANKELQEAVQYGNRLRGQIVGVNMAFNKGDLTREVARDSILTLVDNYKSIVLDKFIYCHPASPASYYLLFETVQGMTIFDSNAAKDNRAFGAVATGWQHYYPNSPRLKVLEKVTIQGQMNRRAAALQAQRNDSIAQNTVIETRTYPELNYPNADDHNVSLTATVEEGSGPVIVDFTAYYADYSPVHNLALRALYEKYADKGMKIYQVCMDYDEHFWKTSADNLPWITVRDRNAIYDQSGNIEYSAAALTYNVKSLPTTFIISSKGEIITRIEGDDAKIEAEIKKITAEYSNGGITVVAKGDMTIEKIAVTPEAYDEVKAGKPARFETMLFNVVNGALKKAREATQQAMMKQMQAAGGLGGLFGK